MKACILAGIGLACLASATAAQTSSPPPMMGSNRNQPKPNGYIDPALLSGSANAAVAPNLMPGAPTETVQVYFFRPPTVAYKWVQATFYLDDKKAVSLGDQGCGFVLAAPGWHALKQRWTSGFGIFERGLSMPVHFEAGRTYYYTLRATSEPTNNGRLWTTRLAQADGTDADFHPSSCSNSTTK